MDLRPHLRTNPELLQEGTSLIQSAHLWYQPFILADGIEVGEGQNLETRYADCASLFDWNVYLSPEHRPLWKGNTRKLADDARFFALCNQKYRLCYSRIADTIASDLRANLAQASVLEVGCNTGLNLFNLARMGVPSCLGVDWTDYTPVFRWLNRVLGTRVRFAQGSYDNVAHQIPDLEIPEVDVVINTVFLNHQSDLLHALCYLADHARRGLLLWILLDEDPTDMVLRFGAVEGVHDLGKGRPFPLSFHNDVRPSRPLLMEALRQLGFEHVEFIEPPTDEVNSPPKSLQGFAMLYARRTRAVKSALIKISRPRRRGLVDALLGRASG